jgi:hypothetical protein
LFWPGCEPTGWLLVRSIVVEPHLATRTLQLVMQIATAFMPGRGVSWFSDMASVSCSCLQLFVILGFGPWLSINMREIISFLGCQPGVGTVPAGRFRHRADIPETEYLHYVYVERHGLRVSTMLARILKCQMTASKSMAPKFYQRNRNTFARHQRCCDLHYRLWCPCRHVGLNYDRKD